MGEKKTSKMFKVGLGTTKYGFRVSDLPPEGLKKIVARFHAECVRPVFGEPFGMALGVLRCGLGALSNGLTAFSIALAAFSTGL